MYHVRAMNVYILSQGDIGQLQLPTTPKSRSRQSPFLQVLAVRHWLFASNPTLNQIRRSKWLVASEF